MKISDYVYFDWKYYDIILFLTIFSSQPYYALFEN